MPLDQAHILPKLKAAGITDHARCRCRSDIQQTPEISALAALNLVLSWQVLAQRLLGSHWRPKPIEAVGDLSSKRLLTLADYKRRQGIA